MIESFKPYWVFIIRQYYPNGGIGDCMGCFATEVEAVNWVEVNAHTLMVENLGEPVEIIDIREQMDLQPWSPELPETAYRANIIRLGAIFGGDDCYYVSPADEDCNCRVEWQYIRDTFDK